MLDTAVCCASLCDPQLNSSLTALLSVTMSALLLLLLPLRRGGSMSTYIVMLIIQHMISDTLCTFVV
jgi:hypothetical protein